MHNIMNVIFGTVATIYNRVLMLSIYFNSNRIPQPFLTDLVFALGILTIN